MNLTKEGILSLKALLESIGEISPTGQVIANNTPITDYTPVTGKFFKVDNTRKYTTHKDILDKYPSRTMARELSWKVTDRLAQSRVMQKIVLYSSGHNVLDFEHSEQDSTKSVKPLLKPIHYCYNQWEIERNIRSYHDITHKLKKLTINVKRVESSDSILRYYCEIVGHYVYNGLSHERNINADIAAVSGFFKLTDSGRLVLLNFSPSDLAILLWHSGKELRPNSLPFAVDIFGRFKPYDCDLFIANLEREKQEKQALREKRDKIRKSWRKINRTSSQIRRDNKNKMIARAIESGNIQLANHIATLPLSYTCFK